MYEHPNAILERRDAGVYVALTYLPITQVLGIAVEVNGEQAFKTVAPELARDAFEHPMIHLPREQVARLFAPAVES